MKVLHICNDFLGSKVHENLYKTLDELNEGNVAQNVFFPLRTNTIEKYKKNQPNYNVKIITSEPLKKYHRIFFKRKINYLYTFLKTGIDLERLDIIHATTLFSDGALALKLKKEFGTPYLVAVRSTDIDGYFRFRPDLLSLGKEILKESSQIIFISSTLEKKFLNHPYIKKDRHQLVKKCTVINNGIDTYWLKNLSPKKNIGKPAKILYVGSLVERKNPVKLIESVLKLKNTGTECTLTLVGDGGMYQKKVEQFSKSNPNTIKYLGRIANKERLKKIYNDHDIFALPSKVETFGLVYLEALSQGLPILLMENQGIDGMFDFKIGEKCDSDKISTISSKLEELITHHQQYEIDQIDFSRFSWDVIAKNYLDLYHSITPVL